MKRDDIDLIETVLFIAMMATLATLAFSLLD